MVKTVVLVMVGALWVLALLGEKVEQHVAPFKETASKPIQQPIKQHIPSSVVEKGLMAEFRQVANQYNPKLPMMLDEGTRLEHITVEAGARIVYHHTLVEYTSKELDATLLKANLKPDTVLKICDRASMKRSLQYDAIYVYAYSGHDGIEVMRFEVDRHDCGFPSLIY